MIQTAVCMKYKSTQNVCLRRRIMISAMACFQSMVHDGKTKLCMERCRQIIPRFTVTSLCNESKLFKLKYSRFGRTFSFSLQFNSDRITSKSANTYRNVGDNNYTRMRGVLIILVVTSSQCLVQCLTYNFNNSTERSRRNVDNAEKLLVGTYNDYIESESAENKSFVFHFFL